MKTTTKIAIMLLLLLIGFVAASASAQTLEIDGMTFEMRDDGTCSLVKLNYDNITKFDVPENVEYEGKKYTVTALGNDVCHFAWEIEKLSLPYTIERIGNDCFSECHIGELVLHGAFPPRATSWSFGDVLPDIQMTPPSYVYIGKIVVTKGTSEFYKWAPGWRHHYKYYGNIAVEESDESAKISNHEKRFVSHGWVAERIVRSGDKTESVRLLYPMTAGEARPLTLPSTLENNGKNWEVSELGDESLVYSLYTELILPPTMRRIGDCPIIYSSISRIRGIQTIEELGRSAAVGKALRIFEMPKAINQVSNGLFHFGGSPRGNFDRIELHENVNYVANYSFFNVDVRNLVCYNPEPPVTEVQSFASDYEFSAVLGTLHVPEGSVEAYKEAPGWREFKEIVAIDPADVKDAAVNAVPEVVPDGLAITVRSEGHLSVEVVDISGRVEVSDSGFGEISHRVGAPGVYIVRVSTPAGLHVSKISITER